MVVDQGGGDTRLSELNGVCRRQGASTITPLSGKENFSLPGQELAHRVRSELTHSLGSNRSNVPVGGRWALEFFENTLAVKSHLMTAAKEVEAGTKAAQQGISGLMGGKNLEASQKLDHLEKEVQIQTIAEKATPASGDEVSGSFGNGLETATKTLSQITLEQDCLSGPSPLEPKRCRKFVPKDGAQVGKKTMLSQERTGRQAQENKPFTEAHLE